MFHRLPRLAATLALLLACAAPSRANESVTYQINPQHTGSAMFQAGLNLPLRQLWTRSFGGPVSYPVIAAGTVLVTAGLNSYDGTVLYALDRASGATLWSQGIPGTYFNSFVAYDNGNVFVLNYDGWLRAFKVSTGAPLWQAQMPGQYSFQDPPTARDGFVYITGAGSGATVYAVRQLDGKVVWSQSVNGGDSAPTLSEDGVFVSFPCQAYEFDIATGVPRWHVNNACSGGGGATTVLYDQLLITSWLNASALQDGIVLRALDAVQIADMPGPTYFPPAVQSGMSYFVTAGNIVARDVPAFTQKWTFAPDSQVAAPPIVVNGKVIVTTNSGRMNVLDGASGALLQTLQLPPGSVGCPCGLKVSLAAGQATIVAPYDRILTAFVGAP